MPVTVPPSVYAQSYPLWPRQGSRDTLLQALAVQGQRVVDVGCGDGRLVRWLVHEAGAASGIGLECSPRQLAKAHSLPALANVTIIEGVAQSMPLPDASADVVIFFNSLHHVPHEVMPQALAEVARVLAPGGILYVNEPIAYGPFFDLCRLVDDETTVRATAQQALTTLAPLGLEALNEYQYCHTVVMASFEAFRERLVSANVEREALFDQHEADLRTAFAQTATATGESVSFDQPSIALTFRKVG